jgi:hypothetical protein
MEISSLCASHHPIDFHSLIVLIGKRMERGLVSLVARELTEALPASDCTPPTVRRQEASAACAHVDASKVDMRTSMREFKMNGRPVRAARFPSFRLDRMDSLAIASTAFRMSPTNRLPLARMA